MKSLFHAFALGLAERLTRGNADQSAYLAMVSTIYSVASSVAGGEKVYFPGTNLAERQLASRRIVEAIQHGGDPCTIAKREAVHPSTVRRIRARIRP